MTSYGTRSRSYLEHHLVHQHRHHNSENLFRPRIPLRNSRSPPSSKSQLPHQSPPQRHNSKMVLEAVMVVVDNSESSRNGDYTPTRYEAQSDAVSMIFSAITQANPESSVGLMSMGGKGPEVLVTLTTDHGKILEGLHRTKSKIRGGSHLATGIQIAGVRLYFPSPCAPATLLASSLPAEPQLTNIACTQAPSKQIPTSTNHSLYLLTHPRRREIPH